MVTRTPPRPLRLGRGRCPTAMAWGAAVLLLVLLGPRTASGAEEDLGARWAGIRQAAIERLHELATWSSSKRLYAARASTYELILCFEPDDEEARKRLRYKRRKDGRWMRKARSSPPRNLGAGKKKYLADLAAWREVFLEQVHPLVDATVDAEDPLLRCAILRAAVPAAPDDARLREANDEVEHTWNGRTRWVLRESQVAKRRRHELERIGAAVVLEVPDPGFEEPREEERCEGVAWGQALLGRHVRLLGTAAPPEMDEHYAYAEAIWPVLAAVCSLEEQTFRPQADEGLIRLYVTKSAEVGDRFLRAVPGLDAATRDRLLPLAALRVPGRRPGFVLVKDSSRTWRLEAGTKELVALALDRNLDLGDDDAWLASGLAHYVTRLITGTRQVFRAGDGTVGGAAAWVSSPHAAVNLATTEDWLGATHDLCTREPKPDVAAAAAKDLRTLTPDEVLLGYGLVAYLVEGHPEHGTRLLRAVGRDAPSELEAAVLEHLGYDLPTLETRLVRWLAETTGRLDRDE